MAVNEPQNLSEDELFKAQFAVRMFFNFFMSKYWTNEEFGMPAERWDGFVANFNDFANTPGGRRFLEQNATTFTRLSQFSTPGNKRAFEGFGLSDAANDE
jgi:hypothetical protein